MEYHDSDQPNQKKWIFKEVIKRILSNNPQGISGEKKLLSGRTFILHVLNNCLPLQFLGIIYYRITIGVPDHSVTVHGWKKLT